MKQEFINGLPFRVIIISSIRPELTSAGQIILHRHLVNRPEITLEVFGSEPLRLTASSLVRRGVGHLARMPLNYLAHDFWAWRDGRWLDRLLPETVPGKERVVVVTVTQGDAFGAARRFAQKHNLPLVTIFHDWWPDMPLLHRPWRMVLERRFRETFEKSDLVFCVSEGMKKALGPHLRSEILYPIPEKRECQLPNKTVLAKIGSPFRVVYAGNLYEYGPILRIALDSLRGQSRLRLEVRGSNPKWPAEFKEEMRQAGYWLDFAPRPEFEAWLALADAFLIPMVFEPSMRRRMETSFPSKLTEFAQFGKPLVIWGPDYCSAAQWARRGNRALCVTDSGGNSLRNALERLASSPGEQQRLGDEALRAAHLEFNPVNLQAQFIHGIQNAIRSTETAL